MRRIVSRRHLTAVLCTASLAAVVAVPSAAAAITTVDMSTTTPASVAQTLVGPGVTITNVTYVGANVAAGTFAGGGLAPVGIGFDSGVILSSGNVASAAGPNTADGTTTANGTAGDADLNTLSGFTTHDASVLEFDFTPDASTVFFRYVFASEEYNEYVNSQFNDTFAFFVNGVNCATVPNPAGGTLPVTINSVNNGNPLGAGTITNSALYRNNDPSDGTPAIDTQMDGLTIVLTCMAPVNANVPNHMKLAIADASDFILDSVVFLEQGSLSTTPPGGSAKVTGGGNVAVTGGSVTFGTVAISDEQGLRGNLQVNDHRTGDRFHGTGVDSLSVTDKTATWSGPGRWNGQDGYTFEATVVDNRNGNSAKKGSPDTIRVKVMLGSALIWDSGTQDLLKGNITVH